MFGGDEVNAIVVDIGSSTVKAGYAGEDTPKAVFPSWVGQIPSSPGPSKEESLDNGAKEAAAGNDKDGSDGSQPKEAGDTRVKPKLRVGSDALWHRQDDMEVVPALENGIYKDWDIVEALWDATFRERLRLRPGDHPMLLAEPSDNEKAAREKTVEGPGVLALLTVPRNTLLQMMFEIHSPPAVFLAKNAALSAFSMGRQTSLVMDCGYDATTVAAVHDGYVLQKSVCRAPLGGATLNKCMEAAVEQASSLELRPRYAFKRSEGPAGNIEVTPLDFPKTTESYKKYMKEMISADIKESTCRVQEAAFDEEQMQNIPNVSYELPDGQEIQIGSDRFKVPEILFNPVLAASFKGIDALKTLDGADVKSLPQMVLESINKCDVDVRKELCNAVLLTGGTSLLPQLRERIERDLAEQVSNARVKVMTSPSLVERRFSVWIGGSILASLGSFQQMWMSKEDYAEHGASLIHRKAP